MSGKRIYLHWDDEQDAFIARHADLDDGALTARFEETFGVQRTVASIANRRQRLRHLRHDTHPVVLPISPKPIYDQPVRLSGPHALVLSDLHIPFHNAAFIEDVVSVAVAWGITECVINGDLIDVEAFSKWVGDPENTFEEELDLAGQVLDRLAARFSRVLWTLGNHEARFTGQATKRQVRTARFLRMLTDAPNIEISSYEWSEIESPRGLYRCVHPKNASLIPGRVPSVIASRRFTDSHVIGAHGHLAGIGRTEDGKRWAIDSGCCVDVDRAAYAVKSVSTRPVMVNGAVLIYNGFPYLLTPETDWTAMRRLYAEVAA